MELDPGIHIVMHLVLFLKSGVTLRFGNKDSKVVACSEKMFPW
jgi:hypothetical protein